MQDDIIKHNNVGQQIKLIPRPPKLSKITKRYKPLAIKNPKIDSLAHRRSKKITEHRSGEITFNNISLCVRIR